MQKREIIFVYLPNTSYFMHFQSVRQTKWNIHNKTNKYRWHFRSKPHQTTSLNEFYISYPIYTFFYTKQVTDALYVLYPSAYCDDKTVIS